ncbi:hypothetical protein [Hoeflea phototrophica]|uniref:hypothetical protein n=1 Tax=Hoeflea phototrophica TaxID=244596 RepID=UPI001FDA17C0|nr:hypothetical protein [Hoeflea phototrophica]
MKNDTNACSLSLNWIQLSDNEHAPFEGATALFATNMLTGVDPIVASFLSSLWGQSDRIVRLLKLSGAAPLGAVEAEALVAAHRAGDAEAIRVIRLREIEKIQSFVSLALLNDSSELTMERGEWKPGASKQKQKQPAPPQEPVRTSQARSSASSTRSSAPRSVMRTPSFY